MKKITTIILLLLLVSCTAEESNYMPQVYYTDVDVHVEFETTYEDVKISIYDVENNKYIYQGNDTKLDMMFSGKYRGKYVFLFEREASTIINPYLFLRIKNKTTNKIIEEYEFKECILSYKLSFIA